MTITLNKRFLVSAIMILSFSLMFAGTVKPETNRRSFHDAAFLERDTVGGARSESVGENESARSDKITGGKIEEAALVPGSPDIKVTVNLPAFLLTLWQDGKEVETYGIGIGLRNHPVVTGERQATHIIFNPRWIPPDSPWVRRSHRVSPGEVIRASDPRNPLGKLKIPLGDAYLIHQAAKPSDIGRLVSHGCIRMIEEDVFDLAEKIISARDIPVSKDQIEEAKVTDNRRVAGLDEPLLVDINYDTIVVEGRTLHIYPDVYRRGTNSVKRLRAELQAEGVDTSKVSDRTLRRMIARAGKGKEFVVNVADIEKDQALTKGKAQQLPGHSLPKK